MSSTYRKKAAIFILTASLFLGMLPAYAQKSEETKKLEEELNEAQSEEKRLNGILKDLDGDLTDAQEKLTDIEDRIREENQKLQTCETQLEELTAQSESYYESMKLRIRYMYENQSISFLEVLLSSESMADALNQMEFFLNMTKYDRNQLDTYEDMLCKIKEKKELILAHQKELQELESRQKEQVALAQQSIANTKEKKEDAAEAVKKAEANLKEQIAYEKELEEQKAREDAKRLEEIKRLEEELKKEQEENADSNDSNQQDSSSETDFSAEELELMAAIIQCEAEGEPYAGKLAVGSVVMNRVHSSHFPNTVLGVIYQSGQFSPVASGRFAARLAAGSNATCTQAAREVLGGNITVPYLFFRVNTGTIDGYVIGNHVFY